jgi:predicted small metal-binding protein
VEEMPVTDLTEASQSPLTVRCACGWEVSGTEDEVVEATVEHGRRLHNMVATREDVLAMAVPAEDSHP